MGERHAFGTSLFCLSRRFFVMATCGAMSVLCLLKVIRWLAGTNLAAALVTRQWPSEHLHGCTGQQCFEVFSCFGFKDTTQHLREPLTSLAGLLLFPVGFYGAYEGSRTHLRLLAAYLAISATVHLLAIGGDAAYMSTCNAYPTNVIRQTLVQELLPPSPLKPAMQAYLKKMQAYPFEDVERVTDSFNVSAWYFSLAGSLAVFLTYAAYEAHRLGDLVERGPLGLGVHYGVAQWDEVLDHDAIRRLKSKEMKSQFIDDAKWPLPPPDLEAPLGYAVPPSPYYGAADDAVPIQANLKVTKNPEMDIIKAVRARASTGSYFEEDYEDDDDDFDEEYESSLYMKAQQPQPSVQEVPESGFLRPQEQHEMLQPGDFGDFLEDEDLDPFLAAQLEAELDAELRREGDQEPR